MAQGREGGKTRRGPAAADFDAADVLPTLTNKAVEYIADGRSTPGAPQQNTGKVNIWRDGRCQVATRPGCNLAGSKRTQNK